MATVKVAFFKCHQVSQDIGTEDEHMFSKVFFDLVILEKSSDKKIPGNFHRYECLYSDVKQTVGSELKDELIEVYFPKGYDGPYDISNLSEEVKKYYIESFDPKVGAIKFNRDVSAKFRDNVVYKIKIVQFEAGYKSKEPGW